MSNSSSPDLFSLETERYALTGLAQYQDIFPELDVFVRDEDFFNPTHKTIYQTFKSFLVTGKKINHVIISSKLNQLGVKKYEDDMDIGLYIQNLFSTKLPKDGVIGFFKELSRYRILRDLRKSLNDANKIIKEAADKPIFEVVSKFEKVLSEGVTKSVNFDENGPVDVFSDLENVVETIGNNPPEENKYPLGPFESINNLLGSLHRNGNISLWAARTGQGKSSIMLYYNLFIAQKYSMPLYWQDCGEMSEEELQLRAAACLSKGQVPLYAIEYGLWRKNSEWTRIIRSLWPEVKKIKMYYEDISSKGPLEIIAATRRFSYNKVGKGNPFIWCNDYLKPFDDTEGESEWRQFGSYIKNLKNFIKNELNVNLQTAIQNNRKGIATNRNSKEVDSSDNAISQDRVTQQVSHALILRRKTNDEIADEGPKFGNMKIYYGGKIRHLGKEVERALNYVKMPDGSYQPNFINLHTKNFYFEDRGDLVDLAAHMSNKIDLQDDGSIPENAPL